MRDGTMTLTIVLLALASRLSAQTFLPAPADQLIGRTLTASEANFSVQTPDGEWSWSVATIQNGNIYACRRASDAVSFVVFYHVDRRTRMSESSLESFIEGILGSVRKQGFQVSDVSHARSEHPLQGGYRFRATLKATDKMGDRLVGFAGTSGGLYSATAVLSSDADELLFEHFVDSFRLLRPVPVLPLLTIGFMVVDAALLSLACWGAFGFFRRSLSAPLATALVALFGSTVVFYVALSALGIVTGARTTDDVDFTLGLVAGVSLVIAASTTIVARLRGRTRDAR